MTIKADWGETAVSECAAEGGQKFDPFGGARSALSVLNKIDSAMPVSEVSLDTPAEELRRMLAFSLKREGWLADQGVTCELKDCGEFSCLACPFNKCSDDSDPPKQHLCKIGMTQEILSTFLIAQRKGEPVGVAG
jgi:hypothetical protein